MNLKSAVIAAAALAIVGFALYLFMEVRANPAQAQATRVTERPVPANVPEAAPEPPKQPEEPKRPPAATPPGAWWKDNPKLGTEVDGPPPAQVDESKINLKLDNLMELANKAYDTQDFDQANAIASKVLAKDPNNIRMLRIVVSSNCIQGDSVVAQQHYERLPKADRVQMQARCDRYGVSFKEPVE